MRTIFVTLVVGLGVGCGGGSPEPPRALPPTDQPLLHPTAEAVPTPPGAVAPPSWLPSPIEVRVDPGALWSCDPEGPAGCDREYLTLAARRLKGGADLASCRVAATDVLLDIRDGWAEQDPFEAPIGPDELEAAIRGAHGIGALLEVFDATPLEVIERRRVPLDGATVVERLFRSEPSGTFRVLSFLPPTPGPHPALIALPGHPKEEQARDFMTDHHGSTYVAAGYAVHVLTFRANDDGGAEHRATTALLCTGSALVTHRLYETLVVARFLRWQQRRGEVRGVAVVAHSGASAAASLLPRLSGGWVDAVVTDHRPTYLDLKACREGAGEEWCAIDESAPDLHLRHHQIADTPDPRVPWLKLEYGFPEGAGRVLSFLEEHLGG